MIVVGIYVKIHIYFLYHILLQRIKRFKYEKRKIRKKLNIKFILNKYKKLFVCLILFIIAKLQCKEIDIY